jgi:hypothetical protein
MNGFSSLPEDAQAVPADRFQPVNSSFAFRVAVGQLSENLAWPRLEAFPRIRKVDGRRSEGGGDARKVIGRCLPPASRHREFRAPDDKRLKSTSEGVAAAVGRWPAGTEGGAKAPACDGRPNFIEGEMA